MHVALLFASESIGTGALRGVAGICRALQGGGADARVLLPEPAALPGCQAHAYDPGITAAWTAGWQRNWRLPLGLRRELRRAPADVLVCCGEPGDAALARLAVGYGRGPAILTWFDAVDGRDAALSQYADLHLAPSALHARALAALAPPQRPVALAPRPIPRLERLPEPRRGVRMVWLGRPDGESGLAPLLDALRLLPEDWTLTIGGDQAPDPRLAHEVASLEGRCELLAASADPWATVTSASVCVVTSDRPPETAAIAEAAARRVPVVAAPGVRGARDLLEGEPAAPSDPRELAAALRALQGAGLQRLARRQAQRADAARRGAADRLADALRYLPPMADGGHPS